MQNIEEQLERFSMSDPKLTVEEAVQFMVDNWGHDPKVAKQQVLLSRKAKEGPIGDRIVTMPDGTRRMYTI